MTPCSTAGLNLCPQQRPVPRRAQALSTVRSRPGCSWVSGLSDLLERPAVRCGPAPPPGTCAMPRVLSPVTAVGVALVTDSASRLRTALMRSEPRTQCQLPGRVRNTPQAPLTGPLRSLRHGDAACPPALMAGDAHGASSGLANTGSSWRRHGDKRVLSTLRVVPPREVVSL